MNQKTHFTITFIAMLMASMLGFTSCQQIESIEDTLLEEGRIIGQDYRLCACCGGWFIDIGDETYRIPVMPADAELDLSRDQLPMDVLLRWSAPLDPCLGDEIKVSEIREK
ncbi:MAG: hypothetical protein AAF587_41325 [Bacteroidota bacterium]